MKKLFILLCSINLLFSCTGGGKKTAEESDSIHIRVLDSIPSIVEVIGYVGDGTSMNVLEVINETGDTIYINAPESMISGSVSVGDKIDIVYNSTNTENVVTMAINMSALSHLWSQRASDGHEQSLELNDNGTASTYGMNVNYDHWTVKDGLLLLQSPKKIGSEDPVSIDTFEILSLNEENLVLGHGDIETIFERTN